MSERRASQCLTENESDGLGNPAGCVRSYGCVADEYGEVSFQDVQFFAPDLSLEPDAQFIEDLVALAQQIGSERSEREPFAAGIGRVGVSGYIATFE
jgi:hypothetical protein